MDRCTDVVELLVEHATDFRMCDLLDDNFAASAVAGCIAGSSNKYNARKSGSDAVSLGLIPGRCRKNLIFIVNYLVWNRRKYWALMLLGHLFNIYRRQYNSF